MSANQMITAGGAWPARYTFSPGLRAGNLVFISGTTAENYRATADVRREFVRPPYPTATGVIVAGLLREGALIEISAVAVLPGAVS
jgi:enamine deaminase RidA (YjgF/YER057c/UK114 family)